MRNRIGLLVLLCVPFSAYGQTPAAAPSTDKPASVEGIVVSSVTGDPLVRAHVTLRGTSGGTQHQFGAMTTAEGKFSMAGIVPGAYSVSVSKTAYARPAGPVSQDQIRLAAGEKKTDLKLKLVPVGGITGRITDGEGEPVEGANVSADGGSDYQTDVTDDQGNYRIGGLTPGRYRVRASNSQGLPLPPEIRTDGTAEVHNVTTYYPGSVTLKSAGQVTVGPGVDTIGIDIHLARAPFVMVSGKVTGLPQGGSPATVMAQTRPIMMGGSVQGTAMVGKDGTFALWRLGPGKYELVANWNSTAGYQRSTPADIEVAGSNVENVELRMLPDLQISGRVEYEDDNAKQKLQGTAGKGQQGAAARMTVQFREVGTGSMYAAPGRVSASDTFMVDKLRPGRYRVFLGMGFVYVKSMRLGAQVIDGSILDLTTGGANADLTLVASADTGSIEGAVQDSATSSQGARVALVLADSDDMSIPARFATAQPDGRYQFAGVMPGKYKIVAVQEADTDAVTQRGGLAPYEDAMEEIEVRPADKVTRVLKRRTPGER